MTPRLQQIAKRFQSKKAKLILIIGGIAAVVFLLANYGVHFFVLDRRLDFQGYAEGEFVYVAAPLAGRLEKLLVKRGENVKEGQTLFELERAVESDAKKEAEARVAEAEANEKLAQANFKRAQSLLEQKVISPSEFDEAQKTFTAATQASTALRQALAQANWRWEEKEQKAHKNALVHDTYYVSGEWVAAGKPVVALLPPENIKARFFVPENVLGKIKIGQRVLVQASGLEAKVPGTVSYISTQAEYTPPVIYSLETRSKLVFLIEASFVPQAAALLHPGQPVDVRVLLEL
ncbi:MAG: efflux RND transporter periplasmic adaptor subunit [bacterium]